MKQPRAIRLTIGVSSLLAICCGCGSSSGPKVVTDPDPSVKIPAMVNAVRDKDLSNAPQLVKDLESDDPAVRFYSIGALKRLTGQTFGYQYFMDEEKRGASLEKWKAWLAGWEAGQKTGRVK